MSDEAPINPTTGKPYFEVDSRSFSDDGWQLGYPRFIAFSNVISGIVPGSVDYPSEGVTDDGQGNLIDAAGAVVGSVDYDHAMLTITREPAGHEAKEPAKYALAFKRASDGQSIWHGVNHEHPEMVHRTIRLGEDRES